MFWWAFWLGVVLVGCKLVHVVPIDAWSRPELERYALDVLVITAADLAYAAAYGVLGTALVLLFRRRTVLEVLVRTVWVLLALVSVVHAVISAQVFGILRQVVTYPLLYVAGDFGSLWSSIERYLSVKVMIILAGAPLAYIVAVAWCTLKASSLPSRRAKIRFGLGLLLALATVPGVFWSRAEVKGAWGSRHDDREITRNPHWALIETTVTHLFGTEILRFDANFPPEYADDFKPAEHRPDGGRPTPGLRRGPKNVLLLVLESVGTQHLNLYGSKYPTMPVLEKECENALVFDSVYAHVTNTANSLMVLTLGAYPPGISWKEPTKESPRMPGTSLAEVLRARGYRTAFISGGDNAYANQGAFLAQRGYDSVQDWKDSGKPQLFTWGGADEDLVDQIDRWIGNETAKPFFVMAWTQGTHHPYEIPASREKIDFFKGNIPTDDWDLGNFLNAVRETDTQLGRVFEFLRRRGIADDTLVIITGDHGEAFGDPHDTYGHSYNVFEEDVHVPFVIWNPVLFSGRRRASVVGAHVDVLPTIVDLLDLPSAPGWKGRSLLGRNHPSRAYFYGAREARYFAVREGNFKYIFNANEGTERLFDLTQDPRELKPVHLEHPEVVERLRKRVSAWFAAEGR